MGIESYSPTPATNATASGGAVNFAEGQRANTVNNSNRQVLADLRTAWNDMMWFPYGSGDQGASHAGVPSVYASATSFTIAGVDVTAAYHIGRVVRAVGSITGTIYGAISASVFSTNTTVTVVWDSGSLSNETLVISLSQIPLVGWPIPRSVNDIRSRGAIAGDVTGNATVNTAAINNVLAVYKTAFVPEGTFVITENAITLGSTQKIYAEHHTAGILKCYGGVNASMLTIGGGVSAALHSRIINLGLKFDSSVARRSGQRNIRASYAARFTVAGCNMENGLVGLEADDAEIFKVDDNEFTNNQLGLNILPSITYFSQANLIRIIGNHFSGCLAQAIRGNATDAPEFNQIFIDDNEFDICGTALTGLNIVDFTNVGVTGLGPGVTLTNNWFEQSQGKSDFSFVGANTFTILTIEKNSFFSTALTDANVLADYATIYSSSNGLNAPTVPKNLIFGSNTSGSSISDRILSKTSDGAVVFA